MSRIKAEKIAFASTLKYIKIMSKCFCQKKDQIYSLYNFVTKEIKAQCQETFYIYFNKQIKQEKLAPSSSDFALKHLL